MDNLRELDARCAELLGWKTQPLCLVQGVLSCDVGWGGGSGDRAMDCCHNHLPCHNMTQPPRYSSDPEACAELDEQMRERGYRLDLKHVSLDPEWYTWLAAYCKEGETVSPPGEWGKTEWEARTRAAVTALVREVERRVCSHEDGTVEADRGSLEDGRNKAGLD